MQRRDDDIRVGRRRFLTASALGAASVPLAVAGRALAGAPAGDAPRLPASILALKPVASMVVPIADDERRARLARAQQLMGSRCDSHFRFDRD